MDVQDLKVAKVDCSSAETPSSNFAGNSTEDSDSLAQRKGSPELPACEEASTESVGASQEVDASSVKLQYLAELIKERKQFDAFRQFFHIAGRLLNEEICRVRMALFHCHFSIDELELPEPEGEEVLVQEKIYVPVKEHPDYNFVGRIIGPRGMTAKQLQQETGCKIMVRGRGSLRDQKKEAANRGKPNWEHLDDDLHVLVQCEDTPNRVHIKIKAAVDEVKKMLIPVPEASDELKRKQLMELAILNGRCRPAGIYAMPAHFVTPVIVSPLRPANHPAAAQPLFVSPMATPVTPGTSIATPGLTASLQSPGFDSSLLMSQPENSPYASAMKTPSHMQPISVRLPGCAGGLKSI